MNHLAHLFLAQSDPNLMIGNFIADHVKGKKINEFSPEIIRGIEMHRAIDSFTDQHALVAKSKERLYPKYHKYAAVIVDMYYDHILAHLWSEYSPLPLKTFASSAYQLLKLHQDGFPRRSQLTLHYMSKHDWLTSYASIEGIGKALYGLSTRASFESKMEESVIDLERDYALYEAEFIPFFKELFEYCASWLKQAN